MLMQNTLQVFENKEFGTVRTVSIDGEPWFVGKDVANALGYANVSKAVAAHVDNEDRIAEMIPTAQNGKLVSRTHLINESGLYSLILSSKLPSAKAFKRWVTSDVLPSIRKHGAYILDDVLREAQRSQEYAVDLFARLADEKAKVKSLETQARLAAPKIRYYDIILQSPDAVQVSIIAKDYGMSAVGFNKMLCKLGVQFRMGKTWLLYQKYAKHGYTLTNTYIVYGKIASIHTCWTQKGRLFLYGLLAKNGVLPQAESAETVSKS